MNPAIQCGLGSVRQPFGFASENPIANKTTDRRYENIHFPDAKNLYFLKPWASASATGGSSLTGRKPDHRF